jgi:hypothetical protein
MGWEMKIPVAVTYIAHQGDVSLAAKTKHALARKSQLSFCPAPTKTILVQAILTAHLPAKQLF